MWISGAIATAIFCGTAFIILLVLVSFVNVITTSSKVKEQWRNFYFNWTIAIENLFLGFWTGGFITEMRNINVSMNDSQQTTNVLAHSYWRFLLQLGKSPINVAFVSSSRLLISVFLVKSCSLITSWRFIIDFLEMWM